MDDLIKIEPCQLVLAKIKEIIKQTMPERKYQNYRLLEAEHDYVYLSINSDVLTLYGAFEPTFDHLLSFHYKLHECVSVSEFRMYGEIISSLDSTMEFNSYGIVFNTSDPILWKVLSPLDCIEFIQLLQDLYQGPLLTKKAL
tara:strand:+ start:283 stop:708 length:426 start_codon:yes stop_codon:yes gene_type:complete